MPRVLGWSFGGGRFFVSEVLLKRHQYKRIAITEEKLSVVVVAASRVLMLVSVGVSWFSSFSAFRQALEHADNIV